MENAQRTLEITLVSAGQAFMETIVTMVIHVYDYYCIFLHFVLLNRYFCNVKLVFKLTVRDELQFGTKGLFGIELWLINGSVRSLPKSAQC